MRSYSIFLLCAACLAASGGCSLPRQQLAALESENRQLDGKLWELKFQIEALQDENQLLKSRLAEQGDGKSSGDAAPRTSPKRRAEQEPAADLLLEPGQFRPPLIELPPDAAPEGEVPDSLRPGGSDKGLLPGPDGPAGQGKATGSSAAPASFQEESAVPTLVAVPMAEVSKESAPIERVVLSPNAGGVDMDGRRGDDGIGLVLEPWDKTGRMLAVAAPVSVVLIDPAEPPESARAARWDLTADETARLFLDGDIPGMHIALPWPGDPPHHERLHLFVRYTTQDGRHLEADAEVSVELGRSAGWIATATPRVYPYAPDRAAKLVSTSALEEPRRLAAPIDARAVSASGLAEPPRAPAPNPRVRPLPQLEVADPPKPKTEPEPPPRRPPQWSPQRAW